MASVIYLIRRGIPENHLAVLGQSDSPLRPEGREQARSLAAALVVEVVARVLSSSLRRAWHGKRMEASQRVGASWSHVYNMTRPVHVAYEPDFAERFEEVRLRKCRECSIIREKHPRFSVLPIVDLQTS